MPWRKTLVVAEEDEKLKFISQVVHKELPMTAACAAAGISRKTGYKWLARYRDGGVKGTQAGFVRTASARASDGWRSGAVDPRVTAATALLGAAQAQGGAGARSSGAEHSGGQHDRRSAAPQWSVPRAPAPAASSGGTAVCASQGS